jgi:PAS domain S-box-containing protein
MNANGQTDSARGAQFTAQSPWNAGSSDNSDHPVYRMRYQELFDFAPDSLVVTDRNGVILEANHAAAALFRFPKEFLIEKPMGLLLKAELRARFYKCLINVVQSDRSEEFEARFVGRGSGKDVAIRAASDVQGRAAMVRWQIRDITLRKRAERERGNLLMRLLTAQEIERRRMSRELHDQFGQDLTALSLGLKNLEGDILPDTAGREHLRELKEIVDRLGRKTHDIAFELRPAVLDDLGLRAAVDELVRRWSHWSGIPVGMHFAGSEETRFASDVESAVYRVIQEALTNVAKHAKATAVSVIVERGGSHLTALIEDDGRGFNPALDKNANGLGLLGMYERLSLVGGSLQVESSPGSGTTVRARIPCEHKTRGRADDE